MLACVLEMAQCLCGTSSLTITTRVTAESAAATAAAHHHALRDAAVMHHTSVCVVPPDVAWEHIQALRWSLEDKGLWRWPPHANLLYPFIAPHHFRDAAIVLAAALANVQPFDVTLSELKIFAHKRSATLWLHPEPSRDGAFVELHAALQSALPQCRTRPDLEGPFTAHVTVGHFESEAAAAQARDRALLSGIMPAGGVTFSVSEVILMARDEGADGQFEPRFRVRLGGGEGTVLGPSPCGVTFPGMPSERPAFTVVTTGARRRKPRRKAKA